jgi:hypothetical protein
MREGSLYVYLMHIYVWGGDGIGIDKRNNIHMYTNLPSVLLPLLLLHPSYMHFSAFSYSRR